MRVTVDIELQESEAQYGPQLSALLSSMAETINTRVVTDKTALANLLREAAAGNRSDTIIAELSRRLARPELYADCRDVLASLLFGTPNEGSSFGGSSSTSSSAWAAPPAASQSSSGSSSSGGGGSTVLLPYIVAVSRITDAAAKTKLRDDLVSMILKQLLVPRPLDHSREPVLPYCDVLAQLVKFDLVSSRSAVAAVSQLIRNERTRMAGVTLLGKLVETCCEALRRCDPGSLEQLRATLSQSQDEVFMYDIEYVSEPLGWSSGNQSRSLVFRQNCKPPNGLQISSLSTPAMVAALAVAQGMVVAACVDGSISNYDANSGTHTGTIVPMPQHVPVSLDISARRLLGVCGIGKSSMSRPLVKLFIEDVTGRWSEMASHEKDQLRFVSGIKFLRGGAGYALAETTYAHEPVLRLYDVTRNHPMQDFSHHHADVITSLYVAQDRDNIVLTGSRDKNVVHYDLRTNQPSVIAQLGGTVSAITGEGDYAVAGSLDRRLALYDLRMPGSAIAHREFESPVLSAALGHKGQCAVGVMTGLFLVNLNHSTWPSSKAEGSGGNRYHSMQWNAPQNQVYAGRDGGVIDIFGRTADGSRGGDH